MGSLNQILAREMSKSKGRASIVPRYDGGNVSPYLEWKKWLFGHYHDNRAITRI